jgi:non-homologous end joining protein Ku
VRPYWKSYLQLALVSCPVALHAACSTSERVALRQINKATGNRLRQQLIEEQKSTFAAPRRVINLMAALRRSIQEDKKRPAGAGKAASAAARKRA